jgi:hypothetical protein
VSRKLSETEVRVTLASIAKVPPDDVTGYVVVLMGESDVLVRVSNAVDRAAEIGCLARAIEHAAAELETGTIGP